MEKEMHSRAVEKPRTASLCNGKAVNSLAQQRTSLVKHRNEKESLGTVVLRKAKDWQSEVEH